MAGRLAASGGSRKKIVNPAGMTADGRQQSKVQVTNKRSARQCDPRRSFAPKESPLPASVYDNYAVRRFAAGGLVRRLWLGRGIWCPMGFSPASVPEGFQRASGKSFGAPAGAYPCWGLTRRLRRGSRAYSPMGRSHFSFGGERKVCKRKPAARRLREKGSYCPFCRRGSQCRAQ